MDIRSLTPASHHAPTGPMMAPAPSPCPSAAPEHEVRDTFVFVLNSSGETNCCKPLIGQLKDQGYQVKVIHFRPNSKEILTSQGILGDQDFIQGTNLLHLPRVGSIFADDIDPSRVVKLVGTPHHAFSQFAFKEAQENGIPTVALVDLGIPPTSFGFRHTFYKTLAVADHVVVPNETIRAQLAANCDAVERKGGAHVDTSRVSLGGNPGFEAFRLAVDGYRHKIDTVRHELGIGKDDLVLSFSSQPLPNNGKVLETVGAAAAMLGKQYPSRKIHVLFVPHPRDLHHVGLKNLFGTETGITIGEKLESVNRGVGAVGNVVVHEMPKYSMEKAAAISTVVLTESSTTAYEAAHSDIPSAFVRTPEQGDGGAFPAYQRIPTVHNSADLAATIDQMATCPPVNLSSDLAPVVTSDLEPYMNILFA